MRWWVFLLPALAVGGTSEYKPDFRVERVSLNSGSAELLTVFGRLPGQSADVDDVPFISVLRDTLGDTSPETDLLRYFWVLTSARPNLMQIAAASLPFFYWRPDFGETCGSHPQPG